MEHEPTHPCEDKVVARSVSFLDCRIGHQDGDDRKPVVVLSLGGADGSVDQLALSVPDSMRVLERIAFANRANPSSTKVPYGTNQWLRRRSIARAEAAIQTDDDVDRWVELTKRHLPDVADFVNEQLAIVRKLVGRTGKSRPKAETIMRRVRHAMFVLIHAMREDT